MTPEEHAIIKANEALWHAGRMLEHSYQAWRKTPVPTLWTDVLDAAKAYEQASAVYADAFVRCVR